MIVHVLLQTVRQIQFLRPGSLSCRTCSQLKLLKKTHSVNECVHSQISIFTIDQAGNGFICRDKEYNDRECLGRIKEAREVIQVTSFLSF